MQDAGYLAAQQRGDAGHGAEGGRLLELEGAPRPDAIVVDPDGCPGLRYFAGGAFSELKDGPQDGRRGSCGDDAAEGPANRVGHVESAAVPLQQGDGLRHQGVQDILQRSLEAGLGGAWIRRWRRLAWFRRRRPERPILPSSGCDFRHPSERPTRESTKRPGAACRR